MNLHFQLLEIYAAYVIHFCIFYVSLFCKNLKIHIYTNRASYKGGFTQIIYHMYFEIISEHIV